LIKWDRPRHISPKWSNNLLISWQLWAQKKTRKSTAAPKLCDLPPTAEAFEQNVYRAHFQIAQWYSALNQDPPPINTVDYANKSMISQNVKEGIPYAPK
jgi:hypothetical protein